MAATGRVAASLAALVAPGQVVVARRRLGAGKTTFVKAYAAALGVAAPGDVADVRPRAPLPRAPPALPVETLRARRPVAPARRSAELPDLGLDEPLDDGAAAIVEWGDRFDVAPGRPRIVVRFVVTGETRAELTVDLGRSGCGDDALGTLAR